MQKLNAQKVARAGPGEYGDGIGLYLRVSPALSRYWVYRFQIRGKRQEMGLGNLLEVGLAEAREKALEARRLVKKGINPIEQRKIASVAAQTFGDAADQYFEAKKGEYGNAKYREMTRLALVRDMAPIRPKPIADISTADVLAIVAPIWSTKWKTADRIRGKIEAVLDFAAAHGLRAGDNPARWRGHLEHLLAAPDKSTAGHHAAMPYEEAPAFYSRLVEEPGVAARALEFTILTAARSGEVIGARWEEIDREAAVWTVPATRMKGGRIHYVPLPARCLEILDEMSQGRQSEFIFGGRNPGKPLSHVAMAKVMERLGAGEATVHGWRSTFRDWTGDETEHSRDLTEQQLAHKTANDVELAYRRRTALTKRRAIMTEWATYLRGGQ